MQQGYKLCHNAQLLYILHDLLPGDTVHWVSDRIKHKEDLLSFCRVCYRAMLILKLFKLQLEKQLRQSQMQWKHPALKMLITTMAQEILPRMRAAVVPGTAATESKPDTPEKEQLGQQNNADTAAAQTAASEQAGTEDIAEDISTRDFSNDSGTGDDAGPALVSQRLTFRYYFRPEAVEPDVK
ncbi:hypothetical protein AC579_645 [Pseudocercospora musae]|uniref:Uncharacterized protein n=1 Tax=Pseudocercospora musae TaxID=113226 RepID=A0A139I8R9_9PEZI|nr:hypothetical protein AC579_645 [Pseudocercospora musae]